MGKLRSLQQGGLIIILMFVELMAIGQPLKNPLRRKDSFFGLHFDFHAGKEDKDIGKTLTREMIDSLLTLVKPDFIQVDCKGHPGISSYPTLVGTPPSGYTQDILKLWRDVSRQHGVALYVHYSGVYDRRAMELHPAWAVRNKEGKIDPDKASLYGPYVDSLLIPQLKELSSRYGIDGVWVDGDCWAAQLDYSPAAQAAFARNTGLKSLPRSDRDPGHAAFVEMNRVSFLDYVQRYASALHRFDPSIQVASNWAYSSFIPRPVSAEVDFLSGDLTPVNSVYSAAFEARCLSAQALTYHEPWDLMSWSFTMDWDRSGLQTTKSVVQLSQEAAEVIVMGGGFQAYFTQNRDGSIKPWQIQTMKGIATFMRARQPFLHGARPIPQIALLYSGIAHEKELQELFSNGHLDRIKGTLNALLDGQQAVEVLMEHHLKGNMKRYPLIIVPEWDTLQAEFRNELLKYAADGGKLLITGAEPCKLFQDVSGSTFHNPVQQGIRWLGYSGALAAMEGKFQEASPLPGTRTFGEFHAEQDMRSSKIPAATIAPYGKGEIGMVYADFGENYMRNRTDVQRKFLTGLVTELFKDPIVTVKGSHLVHVAVDSAGGRLVVNLINAGGPHSDRNVFSYDELPPIGPLTIDMRIPKPSKLTLQPANKDIPFTYADGRVTCQVNAVSVHDIIVVEQ